jgi:hypothetical protein
MRCAPFHKDGNRKRASGSIRVAMSFFPPWVAVIVITR